MAYKKWQQFKKNPSNNRHDKISLMDLWYKISGQFICSIIHVDPVY